MAAPYRAVWTTFSATSTGPRQPSTQPTGRTRQSAGSAVGISPCGHAVENACDQAQRFKGFVEAHGNARGDVAIAWHALRTASAS